MLALLRLPVANKEENVLVLFNKGAKITLIRHNVARRIAVGELAPWTLSL